MPNTNNHKTNTKNEEIVFSKQPLNLGFTIGSSNLVSSASEIGTNIYHFRETVEKNGFGVSSFYKVNMPKIKRIIFNDPTTIVFFEDNSKVVVKVGKKDTFNKELGVIYAIAKRAYGNLDSKGKVEVSGLMPQINKKIEESFDQTLEIKD